MIDGERPIRERHDNRLYWRHDREGTAPRGTMWADVPRGVVRDARGVNCSRVYRWPVGGDAWRVALGVTAGPGGVKYNCRDLQAAADLADVLAAYGQPCYFCKRRPPEVSVSVEGRVVPMCEKCHQISEDQRRAALEPTEDLSEEGYDDGLADMLRDSLKEI